MKKLSDYFYRVASWKFFLVVLAVYMAFGAFILPNAEKAIYRAAGSDVGIIDLGVGFDTDKIQQQVAAYGDAGRSLYRTTELTMDVAYPITYGLLFSLVLTLLLKQAGNTGSRLNLIPAFGVACDFIENAWIISLLTMYPTTNATIALLLAVFRTLKWLSLAGIIAVTFYLLGKILLDKIRPA
jgi:hypothetical protein